MSFVHLHCHSEYSLLDGANRIDDLIRRAQEFEQPALAITDHGNLHAAWEFQEKAKKAKVKPIIGMEAYVAPGDRRTRGRPAPGAKPYYHLVLLARDLTGYRNLVKLSSLAYTEGFYSKPRVDRELLAQYSEGIIVSSACLAGEVAQHLMDDNVAAAREAASWYAELFKGRYYLEVQAHESDGQSKLNERIFALAGELGLPVVATNDAHFLKADDHDAHDVLLCIGLGKDRSDADRMRYDRGLYFKSAPEIAKHFAGRPDVLENTLKIADEVGVEFGKKYHVPAFPLPEGVATENELLTTLATAGAKERYGDSLPANVQERLDYELSVITTTGYAGYFLIVADFIRAARDRGIPVGPGRGSAAGSLVAYSLQITNVCPLRYDLLFERFLNPERVSMPDVDVDFCFERRGEVIEYVRQKYGKESVCQIVTFGTMKSRAAIKDVGRTLGFTPAETDALAKLIPNQPNFSLTVREAIEQVADVGKLYRTDERYKQLLDYAIALEGLSRHTGVHAAGVVIAPGPVDEYVPVCTQSSKGAGSGDEESVVVSQYDMNCLEKAGMLKMDFLGLTTLTVVHDAVTGIERRTGVKIDVDALLDQNDEKTEKVYQMLRAGRTTGVFQFESPLATDMLRCDALRPVRRSRRLERADAPRSARRRHASRLHAPQARRRAGDVRAARARADSQRDAGRHHLPRAGDAYRAGARRALARRSRRPAQSGGQEGRGAHQAGARQVRREVGGSRPRAQDHRGTVGADRDVRPLRVQQVARRGVLGHLVSDRVAQGALSGRLHGGDPVVVDRRHGQRRQVHQRSARSRHRSARAGRERVGLQVHGHRRQAHPLRPGRDSQRRTRSDRVYTRRS